jgi:hypothetical protein
MQRKTWARTRRAVVKERADIEVDGLERAEGALDPAEALSAATAPAWDIDIELLGYVACEDLLQATERDLAAIARLPRRTAAERARKREGRRRAFGRSGRCRAVAAGQARPPPA